MSRLRLRGVSAVGSAQVARLRHLGWDGDRETSAVNDLLGRRTAADGIPANVRGGQSQRRIDRAEYAQTSGVDPGQDGVGSP